jgi:hypothetical protein
MMAIVVFVLVVAAGVGGRACGDKADRGGGEQKNACHGHVLAIGSDGNAVPRKLLRGTKEAAKGAVYPTYCSEQR